MQKQLSIALIALLVISCFAVFIPLGSCTVTWTYSSATNTATASGSGSTNFAALVAADAAGGWGKFTADATGNQITLNANIVIGDGTNACTFSDSAKLVYMTLANGYIRVRTAATFTDGVLLDATSKSIKNGCSYLCSINSSNGGFINSYNNDDNAVVNLYGTSIKNLVAPGNTAAAVVGHYHAAGSMVLTAYHCTFSGFTYALRYIKSTGVLYDIISAGCTEFGSDIYSTDMNMLQSFGGTYGYVGSGAGGGTFKNPIATNVTYGFYGYALQADVYLINPVFSTWAMYWSGTPQTAKVYRQYEFDLQVLNGEITDFVENANVTLTKNNVKIGSWLTNSSGQIDTQTLTYGYYQQSTGDTLQDGSYPFVLTVTHDDWQTYISRFYVTEKTKMTISMQERTEVTTEIIGEGEESVTYLVAVAIVAAMFGCLIGIYMIRRNR